MRVLRKISETTQVILATHRPRVINELAGGEVTVVTRTREHGTLGELWLSYANGSDEAPLLNGGPRP